MLTDNIGRSHGTTRMDKKTPKFWNDFSVCEISSLKMSRPNPSSSWLEEGSFFDFLRPYLVFIPWKFWVQRWMIIKFFVVLHIVKTRITSSRGIHFYFCFRFVRSYHPRLNQTYKTTEVVRTSSKPGLVRVVPSTVSGLQPSTSVDFKTLGRCVVNQGEWLFFTKWDSIRDIRELRRVLHRPNLLECVGPIIVYKVFSLTKQLFFPFCFVSF